MIAPVLRSKEFMQVCWVVPDIYAAMTSWTTIAGVGPFFLFQDVKYDQPHYRGKPTTSVDITAAIAQAGDVQIELVCQNEERPSVFRDIVPAGRTGFHHTAVVCKDYDADVAAYARAGAPVVFSGLMMGFRVCWVDASATLGFMVELIEANDVAAAVFAKIRAPSINWDGRDPIRTLS
jgi:hypothetical protein